MKIKTVEDLQEMLRILASPSKMNAIEYAQILKRATFLMENVQVQENVNARDIKAEGDGGNI